jgi:ATP-dependent Lon protease
VNLSHLALFPLPVVLFPGTSLPLHIFEPRYRRMLSDSLEGDRRFGIVPLRDGADERAIAAEMVGCVAQIVSTEALPDGRSNIVVQGAERFELLAIVPSGAPYLVCRAGPYDDEAASQSEMVALADRVRGVFQRVAKAARALSDDPDPLPSLPSDPTLLSFAIASMIDLDLDSKRRQLASRSPGERLQQLDDILTPALDALGIRARVHTLAKSNGQGSHLQP